MKTRIILLFLVTFFTGSIAFAQQSPLKIGYTNLDYILAQLPASKKIETQLKEYEKQLQSQLQQKYNEYEQKLEAYKRGAATMADIVKQDKEQELINLQNSIRDFEEKAQNEMQKKQVELLEPVLNDIQKAIDKIAEANGYSYVFSTHADYGGSAIILYAKNKDENISDLVLKELGVTPAAPKAEPAKEAPKSTAPVKK